MFNRIWLKQNFYNPIEKNMSRRMNSQVVVVLLPIQFLNCLKSQQYFIKNKA
ncbi:hypothetical protein OH685_09155 [Acinetobacter pittii]|nr:hypothetical protein OH685_09155 [Acinetobacter pittii]